MLSSDAGSEEALQPPEPQVQLCQAMCAPQMEFAQEPPDFICLLRLLKYPSPCVCTESAIAWLLYNSTCQGMWQSQCRTTGRESLYALDVALPTQSYMLTLHSKHGSQCVSTMTKWFMSTGPEQACSTPCPLSPPFPSAPRLHACVDMLSSNHEPCCAPAELCVVLSQNLHCRMARLEDHVLRKEKEKIERMPSADLWCAGSCGSGVCALYKLQSLHGCHGLRP